MKLFLILPFNPKIYLFYLYLLSLLKSKKNGNFSISPFLYSFKFHSSRRLNVCSKHVHKDTMSIKTHQFRSARIVALVSFWSPAPVYLIPLHLTRFSFFWSVARPHQTLQRDCDRFRSEFIANILLPTMVEKPLLIVVLLQKKKKKRNEWASCSVSM